MVLQGMSIRVCWKDLGGCSLQLKIMSNGSSAVQSAIRDMTH